VRATSVPIAPERFWPCLAWALMSWLPPFAYAEPPDPRGLGDYFDEADSDDVEPLVMAMTSVVETRSRVLVDPMPEPPSLSSGPLATAPSARRPPKPFTPRPSARPCACAQLAHLAPPGNRLPIDHAAPREGHDLSCGGRDMADRSLMPLAGSATATVVDQEDRRWHERP
jgi:hypothetical protein